MSKFPALIQTPKPNNFFEFLLVAEALTCCRFVAQLKPVKCPALLGTVYVWTSALRVKTGGSSVTKAESKVCGCSWNWLQITFGFCF